MKSQSNQSRTQLSTESIQRQTSTVEDKGCELSQQHKKCSQKDISKFACITRNCPNYAFLCENQNCQCHSLHENCMIVKINSITKNLKSKIISIQSLEDSLNQKVDKIIDDLSATRDQLISDIRERSQFFGLTEWQKEVFLKLTKNQRLDATGHQLWQIRNNLKIPQTIFDSCNQLILNSFKFFQETVNTIFSQIKSSFNQLIIKASIYLTQKEEFLTGAYKQCENSLSLLIRMPKQLFNNFLQSKIIQIKEIKLLLVFFENKIKSTKLLYRASQNNFLVQNFWQSCSNYGNTIILCKTQFDKIIGGFTCLDWKITGGYKKDQTGGSFLFSLTNNDKFTLSKKQNAIYCQNNRGPDFGPNDFNIPDKAHMNPGYARVNDAYINSKYKKDDAESWQRFSGSNTGTFKLKEWQVWHLQFY